MILDHVPARVLHLAARRPRAAVTLPLDTGERALASWVHRPALPGATGAFRHNALLWPSHANALQAPHTRVTRPDGTIATAEMRTPPELESRPRSEFEKSLMSELACTCGTCDLEPIDTCRCEFAAKMRGELLDELDRHDLSTEATRRSAAAAVHTSSRSAMVP